MPTLDKIRLQEIHYNHNHNVIKDLTFDTHGQTTLLNLENGGGKTVMNQLFHAPYLTGRERNFGDRRFEDLAGRIPSFVLHEWNMDEEAGRFVVGLMITKIPAREEENKVRLELIAFIEEFPGETQSQIAQYTFSQDNRPMNRNEASGYLTKLAERKNRSFRTYNLSNTAQRHQYQDRLEELGISLSEWRQMRNFNQEESGIGNFSKTYPTETALLNRVLIPAVEEKINGFSSLKGNSPHVMDLIAHNMKGYAQHLEDHRQDLANYQTYQQYLAFLDQVQQEENLVRQALDTRTSQENALQASRLGIKVRLEKDAQNQQETQKLLENTRQEKLELMAQQISFQYYQLEEKTDRLKEKQQQLEKQISFLETSHEQMSREEDELRCASLQEELREIQVELAAKEAEKERLSQENTEATRRMEAFGAGLYIEYGSLYEQACEQQTSLENQLEEARKHKQELTAQKTRLDGSEKETRDALTIARQKLATYDKQEEKLCRKLEITIKKPLEPYTQEAQIRTLARKEEIKAEKAQSALQKARREKEKQQQIQSELHQQSTELSARHGRLQEKNSQIAQQAEQAQASFEKRLELARGLFGPKEADQYVWDNPILEQKLNENKEASRQQADQLQNDIQTCQRQIGNLNTGTSAIIDAEVQEIADRQGIELQFASSWMRQGGLSAQLAQEYISRFPLLPYCLLLRAKDKQNLLKALRAQNIFTSQIMPILEREQLDALMQGKEDLLGLEQYLYANFNQDLLNPEILEQKIKALKERKQQLEESRRLYLQEADRFQKQLDWLSDQAISHESWISLQEAQEKLEQEIRDLAGQRQALAQKESQCQQQIAAQEQLQQQAMQEQTTASQKAKQLEELAAACQEARTTWQKQQQLETLHTSIVEEQSETEERLETLQTSMAEMQTDLRLQQKNVGELRDEQLKYSSYQNVEEPEEGDVDYLLAQYEIWHNDPSHRSLAQIETEVHKLLQKQSSTSQNLKQELEAASLQPEDIAHTKPDPDRLRQLRGLLRQNVENTRELNETKNSLSVQMARLEEKQNSKREELQEKTGWTQLVPREDVVESNWSQELKEKDQLIQECEREIRLFDRNGQMLTSLLATLDAPLSSVDFTGRLIPAADYLEIGMPALQNELHLGINALEVDRDEFKKKVEQTRQSLQDYRRSMDDAHEQLRITLAELASLCEKPDLFEQEFERDSTMVKERMLEIQDAQDKMDQLKKESVDHIYDHIYQIYEQLNRIDSSMVIHGSKKLEIILPKLEEAEEANRQEIEAYVENTAAALIAAGLDQENVAWKLIKPETLFALVIKPQMVQIKVMKKEQNRENNVPWSEVAQISGAENFLGALIVILAVQHYQRSEAISHLSHRSHPTAIFMDNPFAYVQSEHILESMLEVLQKTNTQMIALSKVENAAIIRMIPNLYFLHLKLFADQKQHLLSDHVKSSTTIEGIHLQQLPYQSKEEWIEEEEPEEDEARNE